MNLPFPHCLLTIDAEYDPQAPARVLNLVTQFNVLPNWFSARPMREGTLRIVMELNGFDADTLEVLSRRIARIPTVLGMTRTLMRGRTEIRP